MKRIHILAAPFIVFVLVFTLILPTAVAGDDSIPSFLLKMPENEHAIIVEKKTQTLYLYSSNGSQVSLVFQAACSTGSISGPKEKAGDKKTPEGVYFLKDEYEDRYLTPIYGKMAFPSDYPNLLDLRQGKQGSAIWIHGTDKALKPMDSNGCVALENDQITALSKHIRLDATPLIIVEEITAAKTKELEEKGQRILQVLSRWILAMEAGSYHTYLSFYSEDYVPDISWWETWLGVRRNALGKELSLKITLENTGIYGHDGIAVVLMDMVLSVGKDTRRLGKRQLFMTMADQGYTIVGDLFQEKSKAYQASEVPLVTAARELVRDDAADVAVKETIQQWLAAWSSKDMAEYADFYASDFSSEGLGKTAWVTRKKQLAQKYDYITVTGKDFKITQKKDGYEVSFLQNYESSGFSTKGRKQLKLIRKGGLWKISRENWKGK